MEDACRPAMDVVDAGAGVSKDWDRVSCHSVINGSDMVKLVCKETHDGAARFWMGV